MLPEDEVYVKLWAEFVDGQVLSVQAHVGEQVQLMSETTSAAIHHYKGYIVVDYLQLLVLKAK